uniref:Uncharacterized protein n=1 Tax=Janibacter limosus TaxID=53458 RepID=A0AC61U7A6_9MICO
MARPLEEHRRGETGTDALAGTQPQVEQGLEAELAQDEGMGALATDPAGKQVGLRRRLDPAGDDARQ